MSRISSRGTFRASIPAADVVAVTDTAEAIAEDANVEDVVTAEDDTEWDYRAVPKLFISLMEKYHAGWEYADPRGLEEGEGRELERYVAHKVWPKIGHKNYGFSCDWGGYCCNELRG